MRTDRAARVESVGQELEALPFVERCGRSAICRLPLSPAPVGTYAPSAAREPSSISVRSSSVRYCVGSWKLYDPRASPLRGDSSTLGAGKPFSDSKISPPSGEATCPRAHRPPRPDLSVGCSAACLSLLSRPPLPENTSARRDSCRLLILRAKNLVVPYCRAPAVGGSDNPNPHYTVRPRPGQGQSAKKTLAAASARMGRQGCPLAGREGR